MTVKQLLRSVDSAELAEWQAYNILEPFGSADAEYQANWRNALSITTLGNTLAKLHRVRGTPFKLEDFIPQRTGQETVAEVRRPEKQDPEMKKAMLIGIMQPSTGPRKRKKHPWGKRKRPKKKDS